MKLKDLTHEELSPLCVAGDVDALNEVLRRNAGLVVHHVVKACKKYKELDFDDAYAAALEGIYQAAQRWIPGTGSWKTFASWRCAGSIIDEMRNSGQNRGGARWRLDSKRRHAYNIYKTAINEGRVSNLADFSHRAAEFGVDARVAKALYKYLLPRGLSGSFDEPLSEGDKHTLGDVLPDKHISSHDSYMHAEVSYTLSQLLTRLKPKFATIIRKYFFDGKTLKEISKGFDVTESRISQLMHQGLRHLRRIIERDTHLSELLSLENPFEMMNRDTTREPTKLAIVKRSKARYTGPPIALDVTVREYAGMTA